METKKNASKEHDLDAYVRMLSLADLLREPVILSTIRMLKLPSGSRGLDVGCRAGHHTLRLAKAVAPAGHVSGLDLSPELLVHARELANKSRFSEHVSFQDGDMNKLPFDDNSFDWVWSADTIWIGPKGCSAGASLPLIKELTRVVKPGGCVAILFWSSQKLLPGFPLLEARLNTTSPAIAPFTRGMKPNFHFLCTRGWLRDAYLENLVGHTFVADFQAPLSDDIRGALTALFQSFWGNAQSEVTPEDWAEFERICQPESPDFILNRLDYSAFLTYSLFHGKVVKEKND